MANYFYGLNQGQGEFQATVGASTGGTDVELFVNGTTAGIGRLQVEMAIEYLQLALLQFAWPLAASGNYYLGLNVGQGLKDVVGGAVSNSTDFELRINCSNITVRNEVYVLGEVLEDVVLRNNYPPV
jgi:hypothetical protein